MFGKLRFIVQSLSHYRRAHLMVALGVAISAMVLTGTLIVGDSVEYSLEKTTELRLGNIGHAFSGIDRYFWGGLADEVSNTLEVPVSGVLELNGIASSGGGELKLNNVQVHGVDAGFLAMIPGEVLRTLPRKNEAYISENMADRLGLKLDDSFLLRIEKASLIPKNAPFVSDAEEQVSLRLKVTGILDETQLGRYNLKTSQTAPYNVFLALEFLNDRMDMEGKANRLLVADSPDISHKEIREAILKSWTLDDAGIKINTVESEEVWSVESERVFLDSVIVDAVESIVPAPSFTLTYLANALESGHLSTPYSFVAAGPSGELMSMGKYDMMVNDWLADDLGIKVGDSIKMTYFVIGSLRQLEERASWFIVKQIVPMAGLYADRSLMPTLPGLSDAGSCRSWEAGIPIHLDRIRDKDEDYWSQWRGTPKAFIPYSTGKLLWQNRYGSCTAIRIDSAVILKDELERKLQAQLSPFKLSFQLQAVKSEGLTAARGGVDFAQLFIGMSFFLLLSGLTLIALLFSINLERRMAQAGTMKAIGFSNRQIRRLILFEMGIVALVGVAFGGVLAIWYNKLIFKALNTVWSDIVRTSVLTEDIRWSTLLIGMVVSFVLVYITIVFNTFRKLKEQPAVLQKGLTSRSLHNPVYWMKRVAWICMAAAGFQLVYELMLAEELNAGMFFLAGGLLLLGSILSYAVSLYRWERTSYENISFSNLAARNLQRNRARSIRIVVLFALGTFVIVATGLNQKDLYSDASDQTSGTGGYEFYAETTMPVLKDLNDQAVKVDIGIKEPVRFIQLRKNEGDDASCLNLNRVTHPRILGVPSSALKGRFSFVKTTEVFKLDSGWASLQMKLPGGVVPAIADQTVIQWGLGMKVGDTLVYKDEYGADMPVLLIGGLANSIFQGNILIDEDIFLKHFPTSSGTHVFLAEAGSDNGKILEDELNQAFRNAGLEISYTADRLAEFNTVENTYLSIFLLLGGLGMILGTVGLGLSLARNILDRQQELAILRAVGFRKRSVLHMLAKEHVILLGIGTFIGAVSAFVATIPSIFSEFIHASWETAALIVILIFLNGLLWIYFISMSNLRKDLVSSLRSE